MARLNIRRRRLPRWYEITIAVGAIGAIVAGVINQETDHKIYNFLHDKLGGVFRSRPVFYTAQGPDGGVYVKNRYDLAGKARPDTFRQEDDGAVINMLDRDLETSLGGYRTGGILDAWVHVNGREGWEDPYEVHVGDKIITFDRVDPDSISFDPEWQPHYVD